MLLSRRHSFLGVLLLTLALLTTSLIAACGSQDTNQAATTPATTTATSAAVSTPTSATTSTKVVQVKIVEKNDRYMFEPNAITIPKGAQVIWTNASDASHTVTSDKNAFAASSNLTEHQTFKMVFNTAGTFAYHCSIHTYMTGTITVSS